MTPFSAHLVLFGFGLVGRSLFRLLSSEIVLSKEQLYVLDKDEIGRAYFVEKGGLADHYRCLEVTEANYQQVYSSLLRPGDILVDLSSRTKSLDTLRWCLSHGVHCLNSADSSWIGDTTWFNVHQHFVEYEAMHEAYHSSHYPTCLIEFGCNPGLVSSMALAALKEVANLPKFFQRWHQKTIAGFINTQDWASLAHYLGLTSLVISDDDDQEADTLVPDPTIFYSTWNAQGLYDEATGNVEFSLGTKDSLSVYPSDEIVDFSLKDRFLSLAKRAVDLEAESYGVQGKFIGHPVPHEEQYSIGRILSLYDKKGHLVYKPRVSFIYHPCPLAEVGLEKAKQAGYPPMPPAHLLSKEITRGSESVGVILKGRHCPDYYYGNWVDPLWLRKTHPEETPTIIQVSSSLLLAIVYVIRHPEEGFLFPEEVVPEEILGPVQKYLGPFVSGFVPLKDGQS